jgi:predicted MFS family arabinose efflux permease
MDRRAARMTGFLGILQRNRNYRSTWAGQIVSEVGDNFNNLAVFALALENTGSGLVVAGILLSRGLCAILAGPVAGVLLDRMDRKRIMILSDLTRAIIALLFVYAIPHGRTWLLFLLSGLLMFASPFFTSGRTSILPSIATKDELHAANSLTQTTGWVTITIGSFLGGATVSGFGYKLAFVCNALSFLFSAFCVSRLKVPGGFRAARTALGEDRVVRPWHEYVEGLRYMRSVPLVMGIGLVAVGWASGGGAAQILFSLFGEQVFNRGASGIAIIWGFAGIGLICGGMLAHYIGPRVTFDGYKRMVALCYLVHGGTYVLFSQARSFGAALFFIALSRAAVAVSSVNNSMQLLRHVPDEFRGRVFSTMETWTWATMMVSMASAGFASEHVSPRVIGFWSGLLSSTTALFWGWGNLTGRLPEPARAGVAPEEIEVHGDPTV